MSQVYLLKHSHKNLSRIIFSRTMVIVLLLLLQCFGIFFVVHWFGQYNGLAVVTHGVIAVIMSLFLVNSSHNPSVKIAWLIVVTAVPVFGTLLYGFTQRNIGYGLVRNRLRKLDQATRYSLPDNQQLSDEIKAIDPQFHNTLKYIYNKGHFRVYKNTEVTYFSLGEHMWQDMINELEKAEKFIFLEYFILAEGEMWGTILAILERKAREGVEVRVMYDGTCAISLLPYDYPERLKDLNIQAKMFAPIKPFLSTHYNNRDHRKILVIDGKIAYNGGANIADEYINKREIYGHWKDTAVKLNGEAVKEFTLMFLKMWHVDDEHYDPFDRYLGVQHSVSNNGFVIPYGEDPFDGELFAEKIYLDMINSATDYLYIVSPYLIIDHELEMALILAAQKGVKVQILMPHIYDKEIPFAIAHTHFRALLKAGVKIYEYTPGFVHAKMFLSDDTRAIVGTINMDYRSLYHHFECATYLYRQEVIPEIKKDIEETIKKSQEIHLRMLRQDKLKLKIMGRLFKVFAPLM